MSSDDLDRFLENGMAMPQFTLKREKKEILPFLDMLIKQEKDSFPKKMYRKENHAQECNHWRFNHSNAVRIRVMKGLIYRAHLLCDLKEDLLDE